MVEHVPTSKIEQNPSKKIEQSMFSPSFVVFYSFRKSLHLGRKVARRCMWILQCEHNHGNLLKLMYNFKTPGTFAFFRSSNRTGFLKNVP